jgi:hypothetical protein
VNIFFCEEDANRIGMFEVSIAENRKDYIIRIGVSDLHGKLGLQRGLKPSQELGRIEDTIEIRKH